MSLPVQGVTLTLICFAMCPERALLRKDRRRCGPLEPFIRSFVHPCMQPRNIDGAAIMARCHRGSGEAGESKTGMAPAFMGGAFSWVNR
jgi:hypothetical protein